MKDLNGTNESTNSEMDNIKIVFACMLIKSFFELNVIYSLILQFNLWVLTCFFCRDYFIIIFVNSAETIENHRKS